MFQIGRCPGDRLDRSNEDEDGGDGEGVEVTERGYSQNPRGPCPSTWVLPVCCVYSRVDGGINK